VAWLWLKVATRRLQGCESAPKAAAFRAAAARTPNRSAARRSWFSVIGERKSAVGIRRRPPSRIQVMDGEKTASASGLVLVEPDRACAPRGCPRGETRGQLPRSCSGLAVAATPAVLLQGVPRKHQMPRCVLHSPSTQRPSRDSNQMITWNDAPPRLGQRSVGTQRKGSRSGTRGDNRPAAVGIGRCPSTNSG